MKNHLIILFLFVSSILLAEGTGIIRGTVTDSSNNEPLVGANVLIVGTSIGTAADIDGKFTIQNIPVGKYSLKVIYVGYKKSIQTVIVTSDSTTIISVKLAGQPIQEEVIVTAQAKGQLSAINQQLSVVANSAESMGRLPGVSVKRSGGEGNRVVIRGMEPKYNIIRVGKHNTEEYSKIDESSFFEVIKTPLSTFAADVDGASYSNTRRFIMQNHLPYTDAVRTEEFINYFSYDYKEPNDEHPLSINLEYSDCPWNKGHKLIHIGLQGKALSKDNQKQSNLVFLLDVSGSMKSPNKLPLLKKSFKLLVKQLQPNDKVAIVVYAGSSGLVLPSTDASEKNIIISALNKLRAGGSTAGAAGIQLAYKVAAENFIKGGNNRVILATDGDFNVGISSTSELVKFIESKKDEGIFLTALGFGMGNYKDDKLQELADRGNGNHAYIDNILEAKKVLVNEVNATLFTIAKDVKIQVEFNPIKIKEYRLVGYENRKLADKDFIDDTKDAGEIGAGHTVTALYEVVLSDDEEATNNLKYQGTYIKREAYNLDEVLTVKIRYKEPDAKTSKVFSEVLEGDPTKLNETSNNFRFSSAIAEFAMLLRNSEFKGNTTIESIVELAQSSRGKDVFGYRADFLQTVERAEILLDEEKEESKNEN